MKTPARQSAPPAIASPGGGTTMPTLQELFDYVRANADYPVRFNIETKISPLVEDTVAYDVFTQKLVDAIRGNGLEDRAMIQSLDWRTIMLRQEARSQDQDGRARVAIRRA
jgi:glycerophosphoryl diester phosphodiesterase